MSAIWNNVYNLLPAESSAGKNICQDYFGLFKAETASATSTLIHKSGSSAQTYVVESARRMLNEGANFAGFLVKRHVGHASLYVGVHSDYGISVFVDALTSHGGGRIEVLTDDTERSVITSRNEFFGRLIEDPMPEDVIDRACQNYYRVHIAMELRRP